MVSLFSPALSDLLHNDSKVLMTLDMHGADTQCPLQIGSGDTTTGFLVPTSAIIKVNVIPEPSPAVLAAAGFLVLLIRLNSQWTTRR